MVDAKENVEQKKDEKVVLSSMKRTLKILVFLFVLGGVCYGVQKNPQTAEQVKRWFSSFRDSVADSTNETDLLKGEIADLRLQLNNLQRQFFEQQDNSVLMEKFANLERYNLNVINSKADVAAVLGLVMRMDKVEQKLEAMAGATTQGALVLTSLMLVKESASMGGSFEYEAEVLRQAASGNLDIKESVDEIVKFSQKGVETNQDLISDFASIYKNLLKKEKESMEQDWKERLNNKLSEYIKVKKINEKEQNFAENSQLALIEKNINAGKFKKALLDLENINNKELLNEESLKLWMQKAEEKVKFEDAVNRVSAYYLASLRVNFLKKEAEHD